MRERGKKVPHTVAPLRAYWYRLSAAIAAAGTGIIVGRIRYYSGVIPLHRIKVVTSDFGTAI